MNLQEAINHCQNVINTCDNLKCCEDHKQLKSWLIELQQWQNLNGKKNL